MKLSSLPIGGSAKVKVQAQEALPQDLKDLYSDKVGIVAQKRIDDQTGIVLYVTKDMSYFSPAGKARLGVTTRYNVEVYLNGEVDQTHMLNKYNIPRKADAIKHYNIMFKKFANKAEAN